MAAAKEKLSPGYKPRLSLIALNWSAGRHLSQQHLLSRNTACQRGAVNQIIGRFKIKYKCQFKDQRERIFLSSGITDTNQKQITLIFT